MANTHKDNNEIPLRASGGLPRIRKTSADYLSCSRLYNDYDGIQHDYTKKQGLVWREVFLPAMAPPEWKDREQLWNAVEEVETSKDSRLAREFVVALPIELNRENQIRVAARIYPGAVRIRRNVCRCCHSRHGWSQSPRSHSADGAPAG